MGWIRVSDDFYDNGKLGDVGPLGQALYFAAMGFCNRNLTDGFFRKNKARLFQDFDGIGITTAEGEFFAAGVDGDDAALLVIGWMLAADLWHERGHDCASCHARADGGEPGPRDYLVHNYLKFQPSKAEIEAKAEANRKRVEAWRDARKGGNGEGNPDSNEVRNDVGNALHTDHVHDTPTPTPTPSISSLVTSSGGGYVSNARGPRPHCSKHPNGNPNDVDCRGCMKVRVWDEAKEADELAAAAADELNTKRRQRDARENCPRCEGTSTYEDASGVHPCDHQEAM